MFGYESKEIRRGDIYYISNESLMTIGAEMKDGRPAIIVSNDTGNRRAEIVEVVFLTTKEKKDMPTHVKITSSKYKSTALCEQIQTVSKERVGSYWSTCTEEEMKAVDEAILVSLGLSRATVKEPVRATTSVTEMQLQKAIAERDVYKELYMNEIQKSARTYQR